MRSLLVLLSYSGSSLFHFATLEDAPSPLFPDYYMTMIFRTFLGMCFHLDVLESWAQRRTHLFLLQQLCMIWSKTRNCPCLRNRCGAPVTKDPCDANICILAQGLFFSRRGDVCVCVCVCVHVWMYAIVSRPEGIHAFMWR